MDAARHRRRGTFVPVPADIKKLERIEEPDKEIKLGFVIPFGGDLEPESVSDTLAYLKSSVPEGSRIVVSAMWKEDDEEMQRKSTELQDICFELEVNHFGFETYNSGPFNVSKARNNGYDRLKWVARREDETITHVCFMDADIITSPTFYEAIEGAVRTRGESILVPYVQNSDGITRIAAGVATYPVRALEASGGFDESFSGWGYEDLAHLHKLKTRHGFPAILIGDEEMPPLMHVDHEPRGMESAEENRSRWEKISAEA
jgi:hypothetical protein